MLLYLSWKSVNQWMSYWKKNVHFDIFMEVSACKSFLKKNILKYSFINFSYDIHNDGVFWTKRLPFSPNYI